MTETGQDILRFDRYIPKPSASMARGLQSSLLYNSAATNFLGKQMFGYKAEFPSDIELVKIQNVSTYTNALKFEYNPFGNYSSQLGVHYFTLGSSNTIKVMEVVIHKSSSDTNIQGVLVKRGVLYPMKMP